MKNATSPQLVCIKNRSLNGTARRSLMQDGVILTAEQLDDVGGNAAIGWIVCNLRLVVRANADGTVECLPRRYRIATEPQ